MNENTKKLFMAAAVAGLMGGISSTTLGADKAKAKPAKPAAKAEVLGSCTEANSCKGTGSCKGSHDGAKHECKGLNACHGNVVENISEAKCKELKGTFKPNA